MKIALLGYGRMGQLIEKIALSKGHEVTSTLNSKAQDWDQMAEADVWIDFSHGAAVLDHVQKALYFGKNMLIGTTGWESDLSKVQEIANLLKIGVLYAPNCSLGMFLFLKLLEKSAQLFTPFPDYEVGGFEVHHSKKKDTPSGTARSIQTLLKEHLHREVPFTSLRLGSILGKHEVTYDSPHDSITLTHESKSREGFASGALKAAKWLEGRKGFYTLDDYIEGVLNEV